LSDIRKRRKLKKRIHGHTFPRLEEAGIAKEFAKVYELFFKRARDSILVYDEGGNIIEANDAAIKTYQYKKEELLSRTIFDLRKDLDLTKLQFSRALNEGIIFETIHFRKDGSSLPVEVSSQSTNLGAKKVVVSIIRDITSRKQAEMETERAVIASKAAYEAKSEFLSNMSHEIRTPLNGIIGMIDLTMLTALSQDQLDNLATAKTCANSLLNIINDILDFSKIEAQKLIIRSAEFNLKSLIDKTLKIHYHQARGKGVKINCSLSDQIPDMLWGDAHRLQQILNNLLSNAVKFTDQGSINLDIKAIHRLGDNITIQFSVADTGIGISELEMEKLFSSFSQVDGSTTRKVGGTGLGLVISKQLVELMGGRLLVESKKGVGSVFYFDLKFKIGAANNEKVESLKHKGAYKTDRDVKVLLVEDNLVNQIVIGKMLAELGYKYEVADDGEQALNLLADNHYDLCLMDIQMPGLDGITAVGRIRQNEQKRGGHLPIVAITAHALYGDRERFIKKGMDEYIAKPFHYTELFDIIEKLLDRFGDNQRSIQHVATKEEADTVSELQDFLRDYAQEVKTVLDKITKNSQVLNRQIGEGKLAEVEGLAQEIKTLAALISADRIKASAFRIQLAIRRGDLLEAGELCAELEEEIKKYVAIINRRGV